MHTTQIQYYFRQESSTQPNIVLFQTGKFYAAKYLRSTKENDESVEKSEEAIISLKQNAKVDWQINRQIDRKIIQIDGH